MPGHMKECMNIATVFSNFSISQTSLMLGSTCIRRKVTNLILEPTLRHVMSKDCLSTGACKVSRTYHLHKHTRNSVNSELRHYYYFYCITHIKSLLVSISCHVFTGASEQIWILWNHKIKINKFSFSQYSNLLRCTCSHFSNNHQC